MKDFFQKHASVVSAIITFLINLGIYLAHQYMHKQPEWMAWALMIILQTFISFTLGSLIESLYSRSYRDPLTGLNNRRGFYDRLTYEMERVRRTQSYLSLAIIDIDNFKIINDTYGHLEGDKVLKELANIFRKHARKVDTIVRWGGEEFAVILPETDLSGAKVFAERIREQVEMIKVLHNVTICVGIASTRESMDIDKFVALADQALYKAKETKNLVVCMEELCYQV